MQVDGRGSFVSESTMPLEKIPAILITEIWMYISWTTPTPLTPKNGTRKMRDNLDLGRFKFDSLSAH